MRLNYRLFCTSCSAFVSQFDTVVLPGRPAAAQISSDAEATGDASLPDELCEAAAQWL